jgi:hypothetical protein
MKATIFAILLGFFSTAALSATAYWTGRSERAQTVTYKWVWRCEYAYAGRNFWFLFETSCPSSVEIQ